MSPGSAGSRPDGSRLSISGTGHPRPGQEEAQQAHCQGPHLAQPAPHTCQCCTRGLDARRDQSRWCAIGQCCEKGLSPLTVTYIHGLRHIRVHDLCHSTATLLLEQGVDLVVIKVLLRLVAPRPHRRHRHRLCPCPAPPPTRRHRPPRPRAPQPHRDRRETRDSDEPPLAGATVR